MSFDPKSPLLKKRAMDALLESMTTDDYDSLGAHRRGESTPEQKGTEFNDLNGEGFSGSAIVIPPKDLTPPSSPKDAEFFKESEPKHAAEELLPSRDEILRILRQHPLIGLKENPRRVFVIGSVARGEQRPDSDIDILLEVNGGGQELTDYYRRKLQQYFVDNDLHGTHDEVHPQWNGRRVDVYFTSNADADPRPKVKISSLLFRSSPEHDLGLQSVEELVKEVQRDVTFDKTKEAAADPVATSNPTGLKNIKTAPAEIKDAVSSYLQQIADEQGIAFSIHDILFTGSRLTGQIHEESDLDVVVFYEGDIREDDLFNLANETNLEVDGINVDINPVKVERRGELESAGMVEKLAALPSYRPSEKAQTMSAPPKNLGPEWHAGETSHELARNKAVVRDPRASPEEKAIAQSRIDEALHVYAAIEPVEEEIEEHSFYKEAPKVAGHRVKDTGEYDEQREAKVRKIAQETAQYYERGASFDPRGNYLCGDCHYMLGNDACAFVEGDISKEHGTCRYWKTADGKAPVELERKYNKKDAGYVERKDRPFGCKRCEYGTKAKEADSSGRESWCEYFGMHIEPSACCNENNLHGDITFNVDNSKQANFVSVEELKTSAKAKVLYHVTSTATVPNIKAKGILPMQPSNWVKGPEGERYGEGEIFAMDSPIDAVRWASRMDWEFNKGMGTGKISIIAFTPGVEKWKTDSSDPMSQAVNKGKWLKAIGMIKPEQVVASYVLTNDMVKSLIQKGEVKLGGKPKCPHCGSSDYGLMPTDFETARCNACGKDWDHGIVPGINDPYEKTADVPIKSYGMGTPIGGTDNPDAGAEDDPVEGLAGEESLDMTSSLDDDDTDWEAENERIYALLDEEDERSEQTHAATAKRLDNAPFTVASFKIASMGDVGWFTKSARPSEQKLELLQKQLKLTPEQIELCIAVDPSPNQTDFVAWIAKQFAKGAFQLPEDTEKIKGQLEKFQKFKKSPAFTFSKDIQQYDAAKLFETLETADSTGLGSKKEQKRDIVNKGAQVVIQEGDIKIYKVTDPKAAMELGSGTNWCTAAPGSTYARDYMKDGPLYIFFDTGSAVAQLHCESNQFMNRADVCILESVTGDSGSNSNRHVKQFLADPALAKALSLLAAKEPNVEAWVKEKVADPEDVKKILGEAATEEVAENAKYEEDVAQYNKDLVEYDEQMRAFEPKNQKWHEQYEVYQAKLDKWYQTGEAGKRPEAPPRPEEPRKPWNPAHGGYDRNRGYQQPQQGKQFTMQVRNALASGTPLTPEVEQQLVGAGINVDLLLKYGSLFHPGQPWEPLAQTILSKVKKESKVTKEAVDYAAKFVKGRWPEIEPYLLNKLFLVTRNMENMRTTLDYAIRARKERWPEFEAKIQKAKPGTASGYGAAQYAIRVLKKPWSAFPDIKRKKNGKINAEECMIVGNPGEARVYSEAFGSGQRWDAFETSALEANNLEALINYAADTLKTRMPALEEKILSGQQDAQSLKGRRHRYNYANLDLALQYSTKVIKGRWPEYEAKMLAYAKETKKHGGGGYGDEYKPRRWPEYGYNRRNHLDERLANYIEKIIKGRWVELEQVLLARYSEQPDLWATNQNLVDGYLVVINKICQDRNNDNSEVPEPEGNERKDTRRQKPFTKFQQDANCYWPEGEQRLVTRDLNYEKILTDDLRERTKDKSWGNNKENKIVTPEELAKMERPAAGDTNYERREEKPDAVVWNGLWIGWYGMDAVEKYTDYMLSNGQTWPEGVDMMELHEDLEDVRGRWSYSTRVQRRRQEAAPELVVQSSAERFQQRFSSSLLKKKALIEMAPSPSMLPPRDDLKGHMDQQMHDQMTKEVMKGVREPLNPKKKNRRPQIDPNTNPDGVVASVNQSEIRIRFKGKEEIFSVNPNDVMRAVRHAENLSMEHPGFPVVFIIEEEGEITEDTYINGNHVGDTVEKAAAMEEDEDFAMNTQQDWDDDETTEIWLDQVRDSEDEAKRHFMQEAYLKQIAQDDGITMEGLWDKMGEEYTAEFYGYPYKRVSDFTSESTEGLEDKVSSIIKNFAFQDDK